MKKRPRRPLEVYPAIALARSVAEVLQPLRLRPGLDCIAGAGFGFQIRTAGQADLACRVMEFRIVNQGSRTQRCRLPCVHVTIAWQALQPTAWEMEEAGRQALAALGVGNAMILFVGRNGWRNAGLHVIACKIDPGTNRAYQLHHSHVWLNWWARRYGRGWPA